MISAALRQLNNWRVAVSGIVLIGSGIGLWASLDANGSIYYYGAILGVALAVLSFKSQLIWLYTITAATAIFFRTSDVGISVWDVLVGAYYIAGVGIWFFHRAIVEKKKIIYHYADWFYLFFFVAMLGNLIIGYFNGVPLGEVISEYIAFLTYLLYFPAREILKDKKDFYRFLAFFGVVIFYHDLQQFYDYYAGIRKGIVYVYEMMASVRLNQSLYTSACLIAVIFTFYVKKRIYKVLLMSFFSVTVVALITSFSRTFWIILIAEILLIALYLPAKKRINLALFALSTVVILTGATLFFFPQYAKYVGQILEYRLSSSTEGKKDISVLGRIAEYDEVIKNIKRLPLGGNGLRKKYSYYDPLSNAIQRKHIIHNGYLFLAYRMGIPIALIFLSVCAYFTFKSFWLIRRINDQFYRNIALSAFVTLLMLWIANFTSSQFFYRDGMFVTFFAYAFTEIAWRQYKLEREQKELAQIAENL